MAITTLLQAQIVDGVGSVVIGPITQDSSDDQWAGQYTRTLSIYGPPPTGGGQPPLLFTLQLYGASEADIELEAPATQF